VVVVEIGLSDKKYCSDSECPALCERTLTNLYNALVAHRIDSLLLAMSSLDDTFTCEVLILP